jgi:NAD(P)H-flavin reductase
MAQTLDHDGTSGAALDPRLPAPHRIARVRDETGDSFTLEIEPMSGAGRFSFLPGQFNMLYVFGVGEVPISISGDPLAQEPLQHTTRAVGAVTKAMRRLKRGDTIGIRGPFGAHWPIADIEGRDVVIVAGGVGLAPLRPALCQLLANREKYRRIVLVYGARAPEDILFRSELERWRDKFDLEVYITVDRASADWRGNVGVVSTLIAHAPFDPSNATAFVCGPEVMMRFAVMELHTRGVPADRTYLYMERNMKCAIGFCGHCQYGPFFICKDGPIFRFDRIEAIFGKAEI